MPKLIFGLLITIVTGISSIFAGNISFTNANATVEYGQGIYQIAACDDWVRVNMIAGATGENGAPEGLSALTGLTISSLDTQACAGTEFTIISSGIAKYNAFALSISEVNNSRLKYTPYDNKLDLIPWSSSPSIKITSFLS